ncbi:MAG: sensor histidine kinase, partial [Nitrospirae bacterium]
METPHRPLGPVDPVAAAASSAPPAAAPERRRLWGWLVPAVLIAVVTAAHYTASASEHIPHDIFRRLYYLPIILAAFAHGLRGGVVAALAVTAAYLPHALGHISRDPAAPVDKGMELLLYNVVGLVTGMLVERERREKRQHQETAAQLRAALDERRALEGELRRRERLATVGRLTAALAHEIRNPLGSLKGVAQILADPGLPEAERQRLLAILGEESGRLDRVLTDFLTLARDRRQRREPVDLAACARETAALLRPEAERQGVAVEVAAAAPAVVTGDEDLLRQLLWNLA